MPPFFACAPGMGADLEVKVVSEVGHNNQAIFKVCGSTLEYKLIVANLENVVAAHIHCAPGGQTRRPSPGRSVLFAASLGGGNRHSGFQ